MRTAAARRLAGLAYDLADTRKTNNPTDPVVDALTMLAKAIVELADDLDAIARVLDQRTESVA